MIDRMDLFRMGENAGFAVAHDGVVLPASLPELVADLEIFVGEVIAVVMVGLRGLADIERTAVQIGGDDIPADATLGQMIERGDAPGKSIRVFERERSRQ